MIVDTGIERLKRQNRRLKLSLVTLTLLLVAGILVTSFAGVRAKRQEQRARAAAERARQMAEFARVEAESRSSASPNPANNTP